MFDDQTRDWETTSLTTNVEVPVSATTYIVVAMKLADSNAPDARIWTEILFRSASDDYGIKIMLDDGKPRGTVSTTYSTPILYYYIGVDVGDAVIVQLALERFFNQATGLNIDIESVNAINKTTAIKGEIPFLDIKLNF